MMNYLAKFAMLAIVSGLVIGTTSMTTSEAAEKENAQDGLNEADGNVHDNAPQNDVTFHEGTCQGGHSTDVLDDRFGGCEQAEEDGVITDPGNSDKNRQDE